MTYEMTHPWISFQLNLEKASPRFWLSLGEAQSKCLHLAGVTLTPKTAEVMHSIYLARGALASTAIEGNTLSENEAIKIVKKESKLPKSQAYLATEIKNIIEATNLIMKEIETDGDKSITSEDIKKYNHLVLQKLEVAEYVVPGEFRECDIEVSTYIGPKSEEVKRLVSDLCAWLNGAAFNIYEDEPIINAVIKAIVAHIYIAWIHPFGDGNGRTSRLVEFRFLVEGGVPSPAAHLLSNHYNKTRTEYYRRLEIISKNGGDLMPFLEYAIEGFVDQLREQLLYVKSKQWHVTWQNYVYAKLGSNRNASTERQLQLVLAMSENIDLYSKTDVLSLTPEVARLYARKTEKTLTRDLNKLKKLKLIDMQEGKFIANAGLILNFLPRAKKGELERQLRELQGVNNIEERKKEKE